MATDQRTTSDWSRPFVRLLEGLLILAMACLVLDVLWGVLSRGLGGLRVRLETAWGVSAGFLPAGQSPWTEELARFLLIWIALLGAALGFERGSHLGVDYLVKKLDPRAQRLLAVVGHGLVLCFAGLVLLYGGWLLVETTWASGQVTPALALKKWIVYSVVPIAGAFLVLFTIRNLARDLARGEREETG